MNKLGTMLSKLRVILFALLTVIASEAWAQTPTLEPNSPDNARVPTVVFNYVWNSAQPPHYVIAVQSTGTAAYRSDPAPEKGEMAGDPYFTKFVVSEPTRTQIFELAKQANYFKGSFDYTKSRIAQTGTKTLTYMEGPLVENLNYPVQGRENQASFNWSENPAIQQLTKIFQNMSMTFELGRTLDFERRFDKLGLEATLKYAEEQQKQGNLQQLQVIAPVLKRIANDVSVMNIARERAKRLLAASTTQEITHAAP